MVLSHSKFNKVFMQCFIALAITLLANVASAFPSWMGVYGNFKRHNGQIPGEFTILMNQDYSGLFAEVVLKVNNGQWIHFRMNRVGNVDGNSLWKYSPQIAMPPGATVTYYFHGYDKWGGNIWDSRYAQNYSFKVPSYVQMTESTDTEVSLLPQSLPQFTWAGNVYHTPSDEEIEAGDKVTVNIETTPINSVAKVQVVYSVNGGPWKSDILKLEDQSGDNDWWSRSIGKLRAGETIRYAFDVIGYDGKSKWIDDDGEYFVVQAPSDADKKSK